ncbi:MAG: hypothetical protein E7607_05050 [Ruminococcaceae bacterium]|nr:hypothetical protein [Oscillospiraceae bacterium]
MVEYKIKKPKEKEMKKLLSVVLAILMCASVFSMTSCLDQVSSSNGYTKTEVDGFVNTLKAEVTAKNDVALTEISSLRAVCEAKIAILEKSSDEAKEELKALTTAYNAKVKELEDADKANADALAAHKAAYEAELAKLQKADTDNKAAIDALTATYNAKVKELEAADKANADALVAHKAAYEAELAKLQKADTDNKAAIDALTTAYNAKVTELNNKITENTNALNAHKTAYEAKVAELNGKISANETAISNLETELEAKINQVKADTEKEIGEINTLITQLQNADTTNANAIKALTDAYNAKVAELAAKNKANEDALKALEEFYEAEIEKLKESISYLESDLDFFIQPDGTYAVSVGNSIMMDVIEVPSKHKGKAVTAIIGNGFANCENLTSILIPDSVKSIGAGAFENCPKLKTVYVSKNITEIKDNTFSGCSSLETVNIPAKVTTIGAGAFAECASLKTINIPMAVTAIGMNAFVGCKAIERIDITDLDKFNAISFGNKYANPAWNIGKVYLNGSVVTIDIPADTFDGETVTVLIRSAEQYMREWTSDTTEPDNLQTAIFKRNADVQTQLNVRLNLYKNTEADDKMNDLILRDFKSGAGQFHIISNYAAYAGTMNNIGGFMNLRNAQLYNMNLDQPYWNQNFISEAECYDKLFLAVGDVNLSVFDRCHVVFFNKAKATERLGDFDQLYQMVLDKEWTYDVLYEMVADIHEDNGTTDESDDFYGLASIKGAEFCDGFLYAFNAKLTQKDGDTDKRVLVSDANYTKTSNAFSKVAEFWATDGTIAINGSGANYDFFTQGHALFDIDVVYHYESGLEQLKNMEDGFGVLPMPMYDTDQGEYYTGVQDAHNITGVAFNATFDYGLISAVMEKFNSLSYDNVRPFYIEKIVKGQILDKNSFDVFTLIINGARWDYADIYAQATGYIRNKIWRGPLLNNLSNPGSTNFETAYTQYKATINESLDFMDEFLAQAN